MSTPTPQDTISPKVDALAWAKDPAKIPLQFDPIQDFIIVRPDPPKTHTDGGLKIATVTSGKIEPTGVIIGVGPGKISEFTGMRMPMEVKPGQRILFGMFSGDDYCLDSDCTHLVPFAALGRVPHGSILVKVLRQTAILGIVRAIKS